ncbi:MAG: polysaccharide biosynthesis C-terminal domain-containing protein [Dehalococcoidales bacterium]|nr:polysaccharide biosynthesis C-terminal domain-containing protein [Dehalococcoidales bacterium]
MVKDSLKQFFTYGVGSVSQTALNFLLLPLYLRYFEPAEYGVVSLLLVVVSLLSLCANVGMVSGMFMLYYEASATERKKLVGTTGIWYLFGAAAGALLLISLAPYLSQSLLHSTNYTYTVRLVGGFFALALLQEIPLAVFRLEKKPRHYVAFSLLKLGTDFGLKLLFIIGWQRGINGYFESGVIANCIVLISTLPFFARYVSLPFRAGYFKRLLRLGFPFVFSTMSVWVLSTADRLILNNFSGSAEVGIYALAGNFASLFNIILFTPFGLFWTPFFLSYSANNSAAMTNSLLSRMLRYMFLLSGLLFLLLSLGSGDALRILSGSFGIKEGYLEAEKLVPLLTAGLFCYLLHAMLGAPLFLEKKPKAVAAASVAAALSNLGFNFLLIPRFGALGAAAAAALAYFIFMAITYIWAQRIHHIDYNLTGLLKGVLILIAAFATGWLIRMDSPWLSLCARLGAGAGLFVVLIWFASGILFMNERQKLWSTALNGVRRFAANLRTVNK